jgi:hypothetical protein
MQFFVEVLTGINNTSLNFFFFKKTYIIMNSCLFEASLAYLLLFFLKKQIVDLYIFVLDVKPERA